MERIVPAMEGPTFRDRWQMAFDAFDTYIRTAPKTGVDSWKQLYLPGFTLEKMGYGNLQTKLLPVLNHVHASWKLLPGGQGSSAAQMERLTQKALVKAKARFGLSFSDLEAKIASEAASVMYMLYIRCRDFDKEAEHRTNAVAAIERTRRDGPTPPAPPPPAPPQQQNLLRTPWPLPAVPRELNQAEEVARQRAGQRREAKKVRAAQEQAQASRSAVEVSEDAMRAVEARMAAMELAAAAAAAAAGQGSSGRRARTPPPARTAEEEADEEEARLRSEKEEAARLRNEKADAKRKQQEEWLAKQRANKKGKGKAKAAAPEAPTEERAPTPPRVDRERAARDALEDRPRMGTRRG